MKFTQILNIFLIIFFINGCSFLSSFARENPNERYNEEGEDLVTNSETSSYNRSDSKITLVPLKTNLYKNLKINRLLEMIKH